jgi:hypothetical protein
MLSVSIDASIAIAFGLAATITSLIAIYIMWQDRNARRTALRSSPPEYSNLVQQDEHILTSATVDIEMEARRHLNNRESQDEAASMIRFEDQNLARLPTADPDEFRQAVGDLFHAMSIVLNPPSR